MLIFFSCYCIQLLVKIKINIDDVEDYINNNLCTACNTKFINKKEVIKHIMKNCKNIAINQL